MPVVSLLFPGLQSKIYTVLLSLVIARAVTVALVAPGLATVAARLGARLVLVLGVTLIVVDSVGARLGHADLLRDVLDVIAALGEHDLGDVQVGDGADGGEVWRRSVLAWDNVSIALDLGQIPLGQGGWCAPAGLLLDQLLDLFDGGRRHGAILEQLLLAQVHLWREDRLDRAAVKHKLFHGLALECQDLLNRLALFLEPVEVVGDQVLVVALFARADNNPVQVRLLANKALVDLAARLASVADQQFLQGNFTRQKKKKESPPVKKKKKKHTRL